jgi:hypothetical protein
MSTSMADASTLRHEAAHAAAAIWFGGRPVKCVRVDHDVYGELGRVTTEHERDVGPQDLIINIVGWMADGEYPGIWPPPWRLAKRMKVDGVGVLVRYLELDEAGYRELVDQAERLLADPAFQRLQGLIARALQIAPVIDGESVEILRKAAGVPDPQPEEVANAA